MVQSRAKVSAADDVSPRIAYTVPGDDAGHELSQEERESLVKERHDELIKVLDSHDDLVRGAKRFVPSCKYIHCT